MSYEAWRISFQDSEQAARAAFDESQLLRRLLKPFADFERVRKFQGGNRPKDGTFYAVHSSAGSAEITVEDLQAALALFSDKES